MKSYDSNFWKLCFAMLFFTTSYNLVIPEMNAFISDLGAPHLKGLIIGLFTISSGITRPFSGKLSDTIGRKRVMLIGLLISVVVCSLYSLAFAVWFLLLLRFLHGFSVGFFPTGSTALITDLLPDNKRGYGMGIWGTFTSVGMGVGQGLASVLVDWGGRDLLFIGAAACSVIAYLLYFNMDETLKKKEKFSYNLLTLKKDEWIEPHVLPVAIVMFLSTMSSGMILVLSPDISGYLQLENKGAFFIVYVLTTILIRLFTGNVSDKYGRRETLLVGLFILAVSILLIGMAQTSWMFLFAAGVFGVATGVTSPTLFAWTADLSPTEKRGLGAGTMFIALELGVLSGALVTNFLYENTFESIWVIFLLGAMMTIVAAGYTLWHILRYKSSH